MIKIEGTEILVEKLDKLANSEKIRNAMGLACALVEAESKKKAPKGTGELRRSIASRVEESGGNIQGVVYTPLEYAPYVEYGTGIYAESNGRSDVPWSYKDEFGEWHSTFGNKPQPYLRPALDENREQITSLLAEGLTE